MAAKAVTYLGNISIWEETTAYRKEVARFADLVRTTHMGKALFKHINSKPRWMLISPFVPTKESPANAYAFPVKGTDADAYPAGYIAETKRIKLPILGNLNVPTLIGTGKGSYVQVDYHPATWTQTNKNMGYVAPGAGPGEVLFHEMLHGFRMQSGLLRTNDTVAGEPRMDDIEEFYSITASNVYRSERGFKKLRADHWGYNVLASDRDDSSEYYTRFKTEIKRWFTEQKALCLDFADSPAVFNPFREAAYELKLRFRSATRAVSK